MTLTALGSAPLAVGMAAWVFNRGSCTWSCEPLWYRAFFFTRLASSLSASMWAAHGISIASCCLALECRIGVLEISICMPLYCAVFLLFENLPLVLERYYYTGTDQTGRFCAASVHFCAKIYPFVIVGAYVLPLMHQSSLGGLLLLAGNKINPLWQTPFLPLLYLLAAVCAAWAS